MTSTPRLSIGAVSRATGIPVPTLRTWERRYGFPVPERRPSGHRQYPATVIEHLRAIASALEAGHRAAQVVPLPLDELQRLISVSRAGTDPPLVFKPEPPSAELDDLLGAAMAFRVGALERSLEARLKEMGSIEFVDRCLGPFLVAIGIAWDEGRLPIANEHAATECVRGVLSRLWLPGRDRQVDDVVVHATLPDEDHDLGLHMAAVAFAEAGWRVVFVGKNTPVIDIAIAARESEARAVAISVSAAADVAASVRDLRSLRRVLPPEVALAVGGAGAPAGVPSIEHFAAVHSLHDWAKSLRTDQRGSQQ